MDEEFAKAADAAGTDGDEDEPFVSVFLDPLGLAALLGPGAEQFFEDWMWLDCKESGLLSLFAVLDLEIPLNDGWAPPWQETLLSSGEILGLLGLEETADIGLRKLAKFSPHWEMVDHVVTARESRTMPYKKGERIWRIKHAWD